MYFIAATKNNFHFKSIKCQKKTFSQKSKTQIDLVYINIKQESNTNVWPFSLINYLENENELTASLITD